MPEQAAGNRVSTWALVVGGLGVVVGVVALVIALTANHSTNDTAKIARAVKLEETRQIGAVRGDLQRNVAEAKGILRRLGDSATRARRADAALRRDANATKSGVANNRANIAAAQTDIARLQTSVANLNNKVSDLTTAVNTQNRQQKALTKRVSALEQKAAAKK